MYVKKYELMVPFSLNLQKNNDVQKNLLSIIRKTYFRVRDNDGTGLEDLPGFCSSKHSVQKRNLIFCCTKEFYVTDLR